jgi:hypothetical protein
MRAPSTLRSAAILAACGLVCACASDAPGIGTPCDLATDCGELQCLAGTCQPRCQRAPDCGDGYACGEDGVCVLGAGQSGDRCTSEVDCAPGLSCILDLAADVNGDLASSCAPDHDGAAAGGACASDLDCRNGTCALGLCVDVCAIDRDCAAANVCTVVPRVENATPEPASLGRFNGCLPAGGTLSYSIEITGTTDTVYLPVPGHARSALAVMTVDDDRQYVGARALVGPDGAALYTLDPDVSEPFDPDNAVRHTPALESSVLMIPSRPEIPLVTGAYELSLGSFRLDTSGPTPRLATGTATPRLEAVVKVGDGSVLDVHFYFLDLDDHPCQAQIGATLTAATAAAPGGAFQDEFMAKLRVIFARAGIALSAATYDDLPLVPQFDGLDAADLPDLLRLASHRGGVNVFFVRTIAPVGLQILVGGDKNPGDPNLGPRAGVAVSIDSMCYRDWADLGRLAAHAIARQMGLFRNVEPPPFGDFADPIDDSADETDPAAARINLMNFSEFGGDDLSNGQEDILRRSAVLR